MDGIHQEPQRSFFKQILLGLISNFSSLAPSMSLGFSAIAVPALKGKLGDDATSWVASIASVATPIGCFLSGPISDKFGRKTALAGINVVGLIGWVVIAAAYHSTEKQYELLLIGRLITGLSTGLSSMPASVYMAEVSSTKLRPVFTTWSAIFFSLGVLIVYLLGFFLKDDWGTVALVTCAFPCLGIALVWFWLPESPPWLITKGRIEEATNNLCKIYAVKHYTTVIQEEIETLVNHKLKTTVVVNYDNKTLASQVKSKLAILLRPTCLKPFVLVLIYFFFQQFAGTFVIVFYAVNIVVDAGVTLDPYVAIVMVALTRFLTAILVSFLSRTYGRRPHSIVSGALMTICMITLALYLFLIKKDVIATQLSWLPVFLLVAYFFASTLGFLTMPFAMAAEVFPGDIRGTATGLIGCIAYVFNFITVKTYPAMVSGMGKEAVFCFYGAMALFGTIFIVLFLPETKGKSLQEIEEYFGGRKEEKVAAEMKCLTQV